MKTLQTDLRYEFGLRDEGHALIAGLDEAGRGAWAGPVAAGAVILPLDRADLRQTLDGVTDSKLLSPARREALYPVITDTALAWGVGFASNVEIDAIGIVPATRLAMRRALDQLTAQPTALLTDAVLIPEVDLPCFPLIKGDQKSLSIAAASILAKVSRDRFMIELEAPYPAYRFGQHKGYGTELHRLALNRHGPCPVHRQTFAPVRLALEILAARDGAHHKDGDL
jgi:ribonuclease HII